MSDYELTKESPLGGEEHEFDGVTVAEVTDQSLVMVALPRDRAEDIESAMEEASGLSIPAMGQSTKSSDASVILWHLKKNQVLA